MKIETLEIARGRIDVEHFDSVVKLMEILLKEEYTVHVIKCEVGYIVEYVSPEFYGEDFKLIDWDAKEEE